MDAVETLFAQVKTQVDALMASAKAKAADGLSLGEVWALFLEAIQTLVMLAETLVGVDGATKKAVVLKAVDAFYENVILVVDIPWIPNFLERTVIDPAIHEAMSYFASKSIDALVAKFNTEGWPKT